MAKETQMLFSSPATHPAPPELVNIYFTSFLVVAVEVVLLLLLLFGHV